MDYLRMSHPDLQPRSADPEGSIRYHCKIMHLMHKSDTYNLLFVNLINKHNLFIVDEYSPDFKNVGRVFTGKVLDEGNGSFSWWEDYSDEQGE